MLGGGTFVKQDKILPGSYINFVSAAKSAAILSERGVAAAPLAMDWGPEGQVWKLTKEEFERHSLRLLGYPGAHARLLPLREIFRNAAAVYLYRMNGNPVKAANDLATARYGGIRGNALRLVVSRNEKEGEKFDVMTYLDSSLCERQTVASAAELKDNDYAVFKKEAQLAETSGLPFTGGTNGAEGTLEDYQVFMDRLEKFSFHCLVCDSKDKDIQSRFAAYTRRMREDVGAKFQTVLYRGENMDYEGIISVENKPMDEGIGETSLVYWIAGAAAGCPANKSNTNKRYDGELTVDTDYTQEQLAEGVEAGRLFLHQAGDDARILEDVNTLVTVTQERGEDFASNQTIRVLDQIGNDLAALFFNKYMGLMPNDESGRISLWNDIVTYLRELVKIRAIQNFAAEDIAVSAGETKGSVAVVCPITPINCMSQLYMTCVIQ